MNLSEVKNIALYKPEHNLVLSLYLNIDAKTRRHLEIKTTVNHLVHEGLRNIKTDKKTLNYCSKNAAKVTDFFEAKKFRQGKNKSVAIFSDLSNDFFKVIYMPQEIEDRLLFANNFFVRPLLGYLDKYPKYLVIAIDKSRARFFKVESGEAFGYEYFRDEIPSKVREGGWYGYEEHHIERHIEDHVHQHYIKAAQQAFKIASKGNFKGLIIAGQKENINDFKKNLHSYLKSLIVAEIPKNIVKKQNDELKSIIFSKIDQSIASEHLLLEEEISNRLTGRAVIGLNDVEKELENKSVQKFLLSENLRSAFPRCNKCSYLLDEKLICPNCQTDFSNIDTRTNEMTIKALTQDSEIHFIDNHYITLNGGVGALLRF